MKEKEKDEPIRDRKGTTRCTSEGDDCDLPLYYYYLAGREGKIMEDNGAEDISIWESSQQEIFFRNVSSSSSDSLLTVRE